MSAFRSLPARHTATMAFTFSDRLFPPATQCPLQEQILAQLGL